MPPGPAGIAGSGQQPAVVTVRAPAKVNLHLGVGPRRDDGYHEVVTVLQAVSLYDDVTASGREPDDESGSGPTDGSITVTVGVAGEGAGGSARAAAGAGDGVAGSDATAAGTQVSLVPTGPDNLAVRAAHLLAETAGVRGRRLHLQLSKGIPVAAGMAGGSADAAAALLACDALWQTGLDGAALAGLAARLGSDVPFPLAGGTALGTGRGEQLVPVPGGGEYHWVFALADGGLSTAAVYAEFDRLPGPRPHAGPSPADGVLTALEAGDAEQLGRALLNDLQPAALRLRPSLGRVLEAGVAMGAVGALVSGSGPTCAFLAGDAEAGLRLAERLVGTGLCRAVRRACGPVAGAHVVGSDSDLVVVQPRPHS
jgi:4-diphosphocytidyl-2-C-methyl-D-erythritol kinase